MSEAAPMDNLLRCSGAQTMEARNISPDLRNKKGHNMMVVTWGGLTDVTADIGVKRNLLQMNSLAVNGEIKPPSARSSIVQEP